MDNNRNFIQETDLVGHQAKAPKKNDVALVHKVPDLVLEKIFKNLETPDRINAMLVCSRWEWLINEAVGVVKYIGRESQFSHPRILECIKWSPLYVIEHCGISRCIFGDLNEFTPTRNEIPTFWNPDIVSIIGFYGEIHQLYFEQLTSPLKFLTSLTLHLSVFINVDFETFQMIKQNLKHLQIIYTHFLKNLNWSFSNSYEIKVHKSFMSFLKSSSFPTLQTVSFKFPYFLPRMDNLFESIMNFCRKHERSLDELHLNIPYEWSRHPPATMMIPYNQPKINWGKVQLSKILIVPGQTIIEPGENAMAEKLKKQSLNYFWNPLLLKQKRLTRLQYENFHETWSFPRSIFRDNAATLTSANLTMNPFLTVDCKAFENCQLLRRLNLHGAKLDGIDLVDEEEALLPRFINAVKLPITLEDLEISRIIIATSELEDMFRLGHFPQLKFLSLVNISGVNSVHCGMTLGLVNRILKNSGVQTITLTAAFNTEDIQKGFQLRKLNKSGGKDEEQAVLDMILELLEKYGHDDEYFETNPDKILFEYYRMM